MPRAVRGGDDGILTWKQIEPVIRPKIYYDSQTALVLPGKYQQHGRRHGLSHCARG